MRDYYEEQQERNHTARSARQRTGGKKKYMLGSDRMSPSELMKMNGEITVYEMKVPISWEKFKSYPKDIQREYLQWLADEFHASNMNAGEVFQMTPAYVGKKLKEMGFHGVLHVKPSAEGTTALRSWLKQHRANVEVKEPPKVKEPEKPKVVEQPMFFNSIVGCEMNLEGKASEISQTLFAMFRDQKIIVSVVFAGEKENVDASV